MERVGGSLGTEKSQNVVFLRYPLVGTFWLISSQIDLLIPRLLSVPGALGVDRSRISKI